MAPFKLKFRMGGSRSTSQEHDPDPQVNEALLNHHHSTAIGASSSTIDSADCNSLGSLGTNERKSLLPNKINNLRLGYLNQNISPSANETTPGPTTVPTTPPPSYEHVLEENTRLANSFDLTSQQQQIQLRQLSCEDNISQQHSRRSSASNLRNSANLSSLEHLSISRSSPCTDPDCQENIANNEKQQQQRLQRQQQHGGSADEAEEFANDARSAAAINEDIDEDDNRKESIDSTELLIATNMTAPSSQDNLLENCTGENCTNDNCQQYAEQYGSPGGGGGDNGACGGGSGGNNSDFCDPLMNHNGYCDDESHYNDDCHEQHSQNQGPPEYMERRACGGGGGSGGGVGDTDSDDGWDGSQMSSSLHHHHQQQQQQHHHQQQQQQHSQQDRSLTPEIISNKSSKEIYKDLAKQWGITCKMSDGCRCMECQSHYFDCEFDDNEHQKTDGGLGAGTPMFISEVMHGSACNIL